jgi:hypothetical protein
LYDAEEIKNVIADADSDNVRSIYTCKFSWHKKILFVINMNANIRILYHPNITPSIFFYLLPACSFKQKEMEGVHVRMCINIRFFVN